MRRVVGGEAQYSWMTNNNNGGVVFPAGTVVSSNTDQLGSATGRPSDGLRILLEESMSSRLSS